ncbi:MAG TPA: Ppx/GppA phosphatase family protein, partial [Polyangiales bacterium]
MVIARVVDGHLKVVDRMRERVQLALGMDNEGTIAPDAEARALACLKRFGQRLAETPRSHVRAVGTNTFRRAKNRRAFLRKCEAQLGHDIDVLPGSEEARILFRGVTHELPTLSGQRLVVDIGGGSTECILGAGEEAQRMDSLQMGCVTYSERFFPDGKITRDRFRKASLAARLEIEPVERIYRKADFVEAIGSSGTINAIDAMIRGRDPSATGITLAGLKALRDVAVERGHVDKLDLPGLNPERRTVIMGGLAVLHGVFKSIDLSRPMRASRSALREGLLLELVGGLGAEDVRERTVTRMQERYAVDRDQARRVEDTLLQMATNLSAAWLIGSREFRVLRFAARLHEVGQVLSFGGYHRHGAYIVANSDMPGFSEQGQVYISSLIEAHRRTLSTDKVGQLRQVDGERALRLAVLLRLAVRINRGRASAPTPQPMLVDKALVLEFPRGFLDGNAMTRADLEEEQELLKAAGVEIAFR